MLKKKEEKNAIPLVLPIEEISLRPELSSPPRFRIQEGWSERDGGRTDGRKSLCLISDECFRAYLVWMLIPLIPLQQQGSFHEVKYSKWDILS